jgi:hypothetical protein
MQPHMIRLDVQQSEIVMLIDRCELITCFDERSEFSRHANAIKAVFGEELGLHLLVEYFRRHNQNAKILDERCTTGQRSGSRLDGWVQVTDRASITTCYQVEVKSWSAHSVNGRPLSLSASPRELADFKRERWNRYWNGRHFRDVELNKVLTRMNAPCGCTKVYPLACLWDAIHPTGGSEPFFEVPLHGSEFEKVFVFSMSAFLRNHNESMIDLELSYACERLHLLKKIFPETT